MLEPSRRKRALSDSSNRKNTVKKRKLEGGDASRSTGDHVYCHQCSQKRDIAGSVRCTLKQIKGMNERQCVVRMCQACLLNRYGEDIHKIKANRVPIPPGHVSTQGYVYQCPKCKGCCNCSRCRKAKGLEATGASHPLGDKLGHAALMASRKKSLKASNGPSVKVSAAGLRRKTKPAVQCAPRPLKWTGVSASLSLEEATSRIFIREFMVRFGHIMRPSIGKSHIEEFEALGGRLKGLDEEVIAPWVSDGCVKATIAGLLHLIAEEAEQNLSRAGKVESIKEVRQLGASLTKTWAVLASLRGDLGALNASASSNEDDKCIVNYPDPLPTPEGAIIHSTRHSQSVGVACSAQLVPVVEGLIIDALETQAIRRELDEGLQKLKDFIKEVKATIKAENERWDEQKKPNGSNDIVSFDLPRFVYACAEFQLQTKQHKLHQRHLEELEVAKKIMTSAYALRFNCLGTDEEKRTYWMLSPSLIAREGAMGVLSSPTAGSRASTRVKARHARDVRRLADLVVWSGFVAVWGKPIPGSQVPFEDDDDSGGDDDDDEQWWGFWDPDDVETLAKWVPFTSANSAYSGSEALEKGLKESAQVLRWQIEESDLADRTCNRDGKGN
ncbi:hypothetical protein FISHEDRAFT_51589 [Fistulina hepatica ATCC 64428]|uniref:Zinc-finger domain-containing protein n=1 Tax=Fistulina hepatica ATCC 64428 TaxID=1128425 RepID=A0A0D7A0S5_9AGAR|nr:hypothetical protein FISHEDRAFT_51589 [Fistulina hepatica ATCC 64428]